MNIVTDNSAVIEALNKRIEKLESYNAGLANESCEQQDKIRKLEKGIEKLAIAVSKAFPSLLSCDNFLVVQVPAHNNIVAEFKALKAGIKQ
jgi:hypothetical protein